MIYIGIVASIDFNIVLSGSQWTESGATPTANSDGVLQL